MKKILSICIAIVVIALAQACTKNCVGPQHSQHSQYVGSLKIISPNGGGDSKVYLPGEYINVKWESYNVPAEAVIMANLIYTRPNGEEIAVVMQPQTKVAMVSGNGEVMNGTLNDHEEVYQITPIETPDGRYLYTSGGIGSGFKIKIFVQMPDKNGKWEGRADIKDGISDGSLIINQ